MYDLQFAFGRQDYHEERRKQLAYDYQKGNEDLQAAIAFARRNWQRLRKAAENLRRGLGSMQQNPELHY